MSVYLSIYLDIKTSIIFIPHWDWHLHLSSNTTSRKTIITNKGSTYKNFVYRKGKISAYFIEIIWMRSVWWRDGFLRIFTIALERSFRLGKVR